MARRILLLPAADRDLEDIRDFTFETWGRSQANQYLQGLRAKFRLLSEQPRMAPRIDREKPARLAVYREHRILYRETEEGIEIGRVFSHWQEPAQIIDEYVRVLELLAAKD